MKIKKIFLSLAVLSVAGVIGLFSADSALAYRGDPAAKGPNYSAERHEAMEKAFVSNDYEAWKKLMDGRGRVSQVVTKENFAKFAQAHKLAEEGKYAEASAIRAELGLSSGGQKGGAGCGMGYAKRAQ